MTADIHFLGILRVAEPGCAVWKVVPSKDEPSPCSGVCQLDEMLVCKGCGRTIQEIADWPFMKTEDKRTVLDRAADRLNSRLVELAPSS
ncbi:MAG: DUF1289 domain-containing protein [Armatimonadetes bacterium]|nr:DUF1289 domain-containing protein [Armatimonadota bacterium]